MYALTAFAHLLVWMMRTIPPSVLAALAACFLIGCIDIDGKWTDDSDTGYAHKREVGDFEHEWTIALEWWDKKVHGLDPDGGHEKPLEPSDIWFDPPLYPEMHLSTPLPAPEGTACWASKDWNDANSPGPYASDQWVRLSNAYLIGDYGITALSGLSAERVGVGPGYGSAYLETPCEFYEDYTETKVLGCEDYMGTERVEVPFLTTPATATTTGWLINWILNRDIMPRSIDWGPIATNSLIITNATTGQTEAYWTPADIAPDECNDAYRETWSLESGSYLTTFAAGGKLGPNLRDLVSFSIGGVFDPDVELVEVPAKHYLQLSMGMTFVARYLPPAGAENTSTSPSSAKAVTDSSPDVSDLVKCVPGTHKYAALPFYKVDESLYAMELVPLEKEAESSGRSRIEKIKIIDPHNSSEVKVKSGEIEYRFHGETTELDLESMGVITDTIPLAAADWLLETGNPTGRQAVIEVTHSCFSDEFDPEPVDLGRAFRGVVDWSPWGVEIPINAFLNAGSVEGIDRMLYIGLPGSSNLAVFPAFRQSDGSYKFAGTYGDFVLGGSFNDEDGSVLFYDLGVRLRDDEPLEMKNPFADQWTTLRFQEHDP